MCPTAASSPSPGQRELLGFDRSAAVRGIEEGRVLLHTRMKETHIAHREMPAMDMAAADLEKGAEEEAKGAPYAELDPVMAGGGGGGGGEKELLVPDLHRLDLPEQVEGGAAPGKMNLVRKKWLVYWAYWLLAAAASVIVLNNQHIHTAPKDQLFPPELAMFVAFLCAIWLILRDMKKMM